jgi:hypothetical protein
MRQRSSEPLPGDDAIEVECPTCEQLCVHDADGYRAPACPPEVRCFHVDAGKPCTRYLEGAMGEREEIASYLER